MLLFTAVQKTAFYDNYVNKGAIKNFEKEHFLNNDVNLFSDESNRKTLEGLAEIEEAKSIRHNHLYTVSFIAEMILFVVTAILVANWSQGNIPGGMSLIVWGTLMISFLTIQWTAAMNTNGFYTLSSESNMRLSINDYKVDILPFL